MSNNYNVVFGFKWPEKTAVSSFRTSESTFPTTNFHIFVRASDCTIFSTNFTSALSPWLFYSPLEIFLQIVGILPFAFLWMVHAHALDIGINLKYTYRLLYWGGNLSTTFCVSVRPWLHSDIHMWVPSFWTLRILGNEIQGPSGTLLKEQDSSNLVQNMGHKGPVLRSRCDGPGRARTQIPFDSIQIQVAILRYSRICLSVCPKCSFRSL